MMTPRHSSNRVFPRVLPMRDRAALIEKALRRRLDTVLPLAMREAGLDMWLILCQEDDHDPVFNTLIPMDTWCPILQILVFYDRGDQGIERVNLSMTATKDLYDRPWSGQRFEEQWPLLRQIIEERNPRRIGINIGSVQWAAGGLTHNLYVQLCDALGPELSGRLVSAEPAATRWLATLTDFDIEMHEHVVRVAHRLLAECYSDWAITPGVTTTDDLEWYYWQRAADLGLDMAFKPFFVLVRSDENRQRFGAEDSVIRQGDFVRSDVGIKYMRLNSDHQQWAYILRPGERQAPEGFRALMAQANRLQDIFMSEFEAGLTGNEILARILARAHHEGLPRPKVYSHSLGLYLHEPGPLIGLPWEQERCEGRGDVRLAENMAFTMELGVRGMAPEWPGQEIGMGLEEDVLFSSGQCRPIDGRQTEFYLV